jgi:hypothetical protein
VRAGLPFELRVGDRVVSGRTDAHGMLEAPIPASATRGTLVLGEGEHREEIALALGGLPPVATIAGVHARLANLGYHPGAPSDELTPALSLALRTFQRDHELDESGEPNAATEDALERAHEEGR